MMKLHHLPRKKPKKSNVSPKKKKTEDKRPPSPHGTSYYKEEPADFFETNLLSINEHVSFYLTKSLGYQKVQHWSPAYQRYLKSLST